MSSTRPHPLQQVVGRQPQRETRARVHEAPDQARKEGAWTLRAQEARRHVKGARIAQERGVRSSHLHPRFDHVDRVCGGRSDGGRHEGIGNADSIALLDSGRFLRRLALAKRDEENPVERYPDDLVRHERAVEARKAFEREDAAQRVQRAGRRSALRRELAVDGAALEHDVARHVRQRRDELRRGARRKVASRRPLAERALRRLEAANVQPARDGRERDVPAGALVEGGGALLARDCAQRDQKVGVLPSRRVGALHLHPRAHDERRERHELGERARQPAEDERGGGRRLVGCCCCLRLIGAFGHRN